MGYRILTYLKKKHDDQRQIWSTLWLSSMKSQSHLGTWRKKGNLRKLKFPLVHTTSNLFSLKKTGNLQDVKKKNHQTVVRFHPFPMCLKPFFWQTCQKWLFGPVVLLRAQSLFRQRKAQSQPELRLIGIELTPPQRIGPRPVLIKSRLKSSFRLSGQTNTGLLEQWAATFSPIKVLQNFN